MSETAAAVTDDAPATEAPAEPDWQAEAEKWKALARKHEARAKENSAAASELESLRQSAMTDQEKAVAEAEQRGRQAARVELARNLAAAEVKAALTGVVADPAQIVEDLNLERYVTDDGGVDAEKVAALRAKYEALAPKPTTDLKQGVRQAPTPAQDGNAWFNQLVAEARKH